MKDMADDSMGYMEAKIITIRVEGQRQGELKLFVNSKILIVVMDRSFPCLHNNLSMLLSFVLISQFQHH